jgi:hypothetical protein
MLAEFPAVGFRLVDEGWDELLGDALRGDRSGVRMVCPFIKRRAVERLLQRGEPDALQVITRFNLRDFSEGVSDTSALRLLLETGAQIRGVRNLHAKLYLFGASRVVVTSANLTDAALLRNYEFGFVAEEATIVTECRSYFDNLWSRAGPDLTAARLAEWESRLANHLASGAPPAASTGLPDEGADAGVVPEPPVLPAWVGAAEQSFVKFFGEGDNRADRAKPILDEVQRSGSHWACTYPKNKRPRSVRDGAVMFLGRLVNEPNDILIFGRAIGKSHEPGHDDATAEDIGERDFKAKWPHYVRVHHAEFLAGNLGSGVSLNRLMEDLGADAFASTQRNAAAGVGNIDPRRAYSQQAAVQLSAQGSLWLNEVLEHAFALHGKLPEATLNELDWPAIPSQVVRVGK